MALTSKGTWSTSKSKPRASGIGACHAGPKACPRPAQSSTCLRPGGLASGLESSRGHLETKRPVRAQTCETCETCETYETYETWPRLQRIAVILPASARQCYFSLLWKKISHPASAPLILPSPQMGEQTEVVLVAS